MKLDVIHISEAGIGPTKTMGLTGYTALGLERSDPNMGSVMYVKNYIYSRIIRIYDKDEEEEKSGSEIIQIQIDTVPKTSIYGLYLETGKSVEEKEHAHTMLKRRVDEDTRRGHNVLMMGDFNTALNDIKNQPKNVATERLLQWEETGDIRILNN